MEKYMKEIISEDLYRSYPYRTKVKKYCGVYAIVNQNNKKIYVGSSSHMYRRIRTHLSHLSKGSHYNSSWQEDYDKKDTFKYYVVCECPEGEELKKETEVLDSYDMTELYNTWRPPQLDELLPFLEKATKTKTYNGYVVNKETGCWESQACHSNGGYSKVIVYIDGKYRHLLKHRVAYWQAHGEYPELVRHKCNNKACMNPSHLEKGTHKQNAYDKNRDFYKKFREVWISLGGDPVEITKHFGWKPTLSTTRGGVAGAFYRYEKKTGIKEEFPEIIKKRKRAVSGNALGIVYNKDAVVFTKEEKDYIRENYKNMSDAKIAEELNKRDKRLTSAILIKRKDIFSCRYLELRLTKRPKYNRDNFDIEKALELYKQGKSFLAIAKELSVSDKVVRRLIKNETE
jgi:hypothetical protein